MFSLFTFLIRVILNLLKSKIRRSCDRWSHKPQAVYFHIVLVAKSTRDEEFFVKKGVF